jgi:transcriptional regulator with XRE-family HTH domain
MSEKLSLAKKIKKYRKDLGLSQKQLAKLLNLPRPSVSHMESGQREVSSSELAELSKIFRVSADDLLSEIMDKRRRIPTKISVQPKFNKEKIKQVLIYVLQKCGAKPNVGETVLFKLLYFIDFDYYELYEEYLTGESYRKISYGPAPCHFNTIVREMIGKQLQKVSTEYYGKPQKKYIPLVEPNLRELNARELEVVDRVIERLSSMNAAAIEEYSHQDVPWEITKDREIISYDTVFYRKASYSVRVYPKD